MASHPVGATTCKTAWSAKQSDQNENLEKHFILRSDADRTRAWKIDRERYYAHTWVARGALRDPQPSLIDGAADRALGALLAAIGLRPLLKFLCQKQGVALE